MNARPKVGVAVILMKDNKILMGKRKGLLGQGFWAPPGGHLEFGETFEECARREMKEETGLEFNEIKQGPTTNDIFHENDKHYITVFMIAKYEKGNPEVLEPEKCEGWYWFEKSQLPTPLFLPVENFLKLDSDF